jgi:hypothetical protein
MNHIGYFPIGSAVGYRVYKEWDLGRRWEVEIRHGTVKRTFTRCGAFRAADKHYKRQKAEYERRSCPCQS